MLTKRNPPKYIHIFSRIIWFTADIPMQRSVIKAVLTMVALVAASEKG